LKKENITINKKTFCVVSNEEKNKRYLFIKREKEIIGFFFLSTIHRHKKNVVARTN